MISLDSFKKTLSNLPGWRTERKLVVIESDDWGSIRMPSHESFLRLKACGVALEQGDSRRYNLYDTLATTSDLESLFELLTRYRDKNGNHPVITPITVVANPDFEKIKAADYLQYFYEPFTETLRRYNRPGAFETWQQGLKERLFVPQFHSREHLNIASWLKALQAGDKHTQAAFDEQMWGFVNKNANGISYQAAFDLEDLGEVATQRAIIQEGLDLFERIFKYRASYFVPPNGPFNNQLEKVAASAGIRYMCANKIQREPIGKGQYKSRFHYMGQKNKHNQIYITRNCFFEPGDTGKDWIGNCTKEINNAFKWKKPAVISTHRVNYIGAIFSNNRQNGLKHLQQLLSIIMRTWPDVEFITSGELGKIITDSRCRP